MEVLRRYLCIHFPHKISPAMHDVLAHPALVEVLTRIIGPNVKCMQSMLFIKASGKPGQAWHQDEFFIPTRDRSLMGLQSELLGAHAVGVRNILALTGDPPSLGDYPESSAVYDVDSVGLIRVLGR